MLRIFPRLRAGRGLWCISARFTLLTGPPKGLRAGRFHSKPILLLGCFSQFVYLHLKKGIL